jgi:hypothetical protein
MGLPGLAEDRVLFTLGINNTLWRWISLVIQKCGRKVKGLTSSLTWNEGFGRYCSTGSWPYMTFLHRTQRYTVYSGMRLTHGVLGFCFGVVSAKMHSEALEARIETFVLAFMEDKWVARLCYDLPWRLPRFPFSLALDG